MRRHAVSSACGVPIRGTKKANFRIYGTGNKKRGQPRKCFFLFLQSNTNLPIARCRSDGGWRITEDIHIVEIYRYHNRGIVGRQP